MRSRTILVATTAAGYKADGGDSGCAWLTHAGEMIADAQSVGHQISWFAALETGNRDLNPFVYMESRIAALGGDVWRFSFDDGAATVTNETRLRRICIGRNIITDFAMSRGFEWVLFLDSDVTPNPATFTGLLALNWPIVGCDVPQYCLDGPVIRTWSDVASVHPEAGERLKFTDPSEVLPGDVRAHWNTAGYLMVHRSLFRRLRWTIDIDAGLTDDPAYQRDAREWFGAPTLVRHDLVGDHAPLVALDHRAADMSLGTV